MMLSKLLALALLLSQFALSLGLTLEETRSRLSQAFSSPSGKLTFSPEIVIPDPSDITAILLQTNAVQTLSARIRAAKANSIFVQGSTQALQTLVREQEAARGSFPGPVPVVYCSQAADISISDIAETGAEGLLLRICEGNECTGVDDLDKDALFVQTAKTALNYGLQPIPEITMAEESAAKWTEEHVTMLVDKLSNIMGCDPVAVLVSVNPTNGEGDEPVALPPIPKALKKRVPILGSVRVSGGEGRLGEETLRFKDAGYAGAFLRSDCVPGFRMNMDLDMVSQFWAACINDLKSTRSKSFSFRAKNNMDKTLGTQWANLQNSVIESGALGDPNDQVSIMDEASGDYKGF